MIFAAMMTESSPSNSNADARDTSRWATAGVTLLVLLAVYVGAYFAVLALPVAWRLPERSTPGFIPPAPMLEEAGPGRSYLRPDYHGLPDWFFSPIHRADRWLRPKRWIIQWDW